MLSYDVPSAELPPEALVLEQHRQVLQPDIGSLAPGESVSCGSVLSTLRELKKLLKQGTAPDSNSLRAFFYMGVTALQKAQDTLLGIARGILTRMDNVKDPRNLALCSKVLKEVFMRGELTRHNTSLKTATYTSTLMSGLSRALKFIATGQGKQCLDFALLVLVLGYYNLPLVCRSTLIGG